MRNRPKILQTPYLKTTGYSLTDCGNAERLIGQHGDCLRFCQAKREWFVWNGCKWAPDDGASLQLVKKTIRAMCHERLQLLSSLNANGDNWKELSNQINELTDWANRSERASHLAATLRLASADPRISAKPDDFDQHHHLLNLPNGTFDMRKAVFREHRPEDLLTKVAGAELRADASCPCWGEFLMEVFASHTDIIPYIQRAVGYTLTGETKEECIFLLSGSGGNGKGTFLGTLHHLLGDYGGVVEMDTFLVTGATKLREDIADMHGRRYVSAQEPFINSRFAEGTLKWVSGGDKLRARRLWEHAQEFLPTHKLWLAMNHVPLFSANDKAIWRRLHIIPFDEYFADNANLELKQQLQRELSGILNWALEGQSIWKRHGLGTCDSVKRATEACRTEGGVEREAKQVGLATPVAR